VDKKLSVWSWCQTWSQLQSQKQTVQQRHHLKWNTPGSWRHHGQWPSPNFEPNRFHDYHFSHVDMFAFWPFELWLGFCDTLDHHSKTQCACSDRPFSGTVVLTETNWGDSHSTRYAKTCLQ
jgi:hypothetical protein